jgi:hypothetical protein
MESLTIPKLQYIKLDETQDVCGTGREPLLNYRLLGCKQIINTYRDNMFQLYNHEPFTIPALTEKTIYFNVLIMTNVPAKCIISAGTELSLHKISYTINIIHTNDDFINLTFYNPTSSDIVLSPYTCRIFCQLVTPNPYNLN